MAETFGEWLYSKFVEWSNDYFKENGKLPSQRQFAEWLGKPTPNVNLWINDQRLPTGENIDDLADRLGPEVYDRLGVRRPMPNDERLKKIIDLASLLPDEEQEKYIKDMERDVERSKKQRPKVELSAVPC